MCVEYEIFHNNLIRFVGEIFYPNKGLNYKSKMIENRSDNFADKQVDACLINKLKSCRNGIESANDVRVT